MKALNKIIVSIFLIIATVTNAQIKIHSGGNVSVGSLIAPPGGFKLQVIGNSVFSSSNSSLTSSAYIRGLNGYSTATTPDYTWWGNDQTGLFHPASDVLGITVGGQERMRVTYGAIQINATTNYATPLFINATAPNAGGYTMRYNGQDNFYVHASGWIYSQGQYIGSDKNFKKDITNIPNSLDKVLKLRGVNYKLNRSEAMSAFNTNDLCMGVVAQEVEKVVPEVVKTFPDGTKAVAYQNLVGLLIEAIKEQQTQIEVLEKKVNSTKVLSSEIENSIVDTAKKNVLFQNTPNPFSESTHIKYFIESSTQSSALYVFDMQGNLLKTYEDLTNGHGEIVINGGDLNAGMYMYSLIVDDVEIDMKRMILTK